MTGRSWAEPWRIKVVEPLRLTGIRVVLDAARAIENAWFIQQREPGIRAIASRTYEPSHLRFFQARFAPVRTTGLIPRGQRRSSFELAGKAG